MLRRIHEAGYEFRPGADVRHAFVVVDADDARLRRLALGSVETLQRMRSANTDGADAARGDPANPQAGRQGAPGRRVA